MTKLNRPRIEDGFFVYQSLEGIADSQMES